MLKEIPIYQADPLAKITKRWFQNEFFDLFIWFNPSGQIKSFQLCYNRTRREAVIVWDVMQGFSFHGIDDGECSPHKNMTPVFTKPKGKPDPRLVARFTNDSMLITPDLRNFLVQKLTEFFAPFS